MAKDEIIVSGYRLRTEQERALHKGLKDLEENHRYPDGRPKIPLDEPALRELLEHINSLEATQQELEELRGHFAQRVSNKLLLDPVDMKKQAERALRDLRKAKKPLPQHGHDHAHLWHAKWRK